MLKVWTLEGLRDTIHPVSTRTVPISQVGPLRQGLSVARYVQEQGERLRVLQVANLEGLDVVPKVDDRFETFDEGRVASEMVRPGQVLIALRTTSLKAAVVPEGFEPAVAANGLTVLEVNPDHADPHFIAALLRSEAMQRRVVGLYSGSSIQGIPLGRFKALSLTLPALTVQQAFVEAFRALEAYTTQAQSLEKLRREELEVLLSPYSLEGV